MNDQIALQVGIDWSDLKHDYCLGRPEEAKSEYGVIAAEPTRLHEWIATLRERCPEGLIEVCVELSRGPLIEVLCQYQFVRVYPVNPLMANRFRESLYPSLRKDDPLDARLLLDLLRKHPEHLRVLQRPNGPMRMLRGLIEARRRHVARRTRLIQSLISNLKGYFPQALLLAGDLDEAISWAFLTRWPSWQSLASVREQTLRKFYHANQCRSEELIAERLELLRKSRALTDDEVTVELGRTETLALVEELRTSGKIIAQHDRAIAESFGQIEEASLFAHVPGAGKVMAPRLLVAFGCNSAHCEDAADLAAYAGVAPLLQRSGKSYVVKKRFRVPEFLHQSFVEFAHWSTRYSRWAREYYRQRKKRGQAHWSILRALAYKWIRILWRCWHTRTAYHEDAYMQTLKKRGSPLANAL